MLVILQIYASNKKSEEKLTPQNSSQPAAKRPIQKLLGYLKRTENINQKLLFYAMITMPSKRLFVCITFYITTIKGKIKENVEISTETNI